MGRKTPTGKELLKKAEARGYQHGAHREKDVIKDIPKYVQKTLNDQNWALKRYVRWTEGIEERGGKGAKAERGDETSETNSISTASCLRKESPCPDLATTKDFLRFHIALSRGKIRDKTTVDSVKTFAEWFFAGFTRVTGTVITEDYRSAIYEWVRTVLTKEHLVVNVKKPKHLFGKHDLIRFHTTFWTKDDASFIHPRNKVQIPFIIDVFCWTGARIGAFFPNSDNKNEGGLRYKDIEVVLLCIPDGWKVIYRIDQRWVKNNRDPQNTTYGASTSQHVKLIFDDTQYLLALAFADKAFYGINSPEEFWQLQIKEGEEAFNLRWNDSVKNLPILRNATLKKGVSNDPLPKATFEDIIRSVMQMSGYFGYPTVHAIRRYLGKKLNERYTETERSQHITQNDPRVYGQSYVANTSSCDGRRAFLNETGQHDHIDYFQGFGKFRENGLPRRLPAEKEAALEKDEGLIERRKRVQQLKDEGASSNDIKKANNDIRSYQSSLRRTRLREYQIWWVQDRRDWKIRTGGKEQADDSTPTELVKALSVIIPERGRLTEMMTSDKVVSERERKQAIIDLYSFITRDYTVLYRPGEEPIDGTCPVKGCGTKTNSLHEDQRAIHIHNCRQKELEEALIRPPSDLTYCFQCFTWLVEEDWNTHFTQHFNSVSSRRCGSITYCHTLIRPAYCPFCLGNRTLPAEKKLQAWTRDSDLMVHLEKHISQVHWPSPCPHPLCNIEVIDGTSCWYHLSDVHDLRRACKKGQKRRWKAVATENDDRLQSGTSHQVKKKLKTKRKEDTVETEVIKYSPLHSFELSPAPANGNSLHEKRGHIPRRQLITSIDPTTISSPLTLLSSTSLTARDYDHDTEHSTVPNLTYTSNSSPGSSTPCPTESYSSIRSNYDQGGSSRLLDFLRVESRANSKESTGIMVVDLTEDKSPEYDDLLSKYTTIPSSTCSSVKGASDDDSNKDLSDLVSNKPCRPPERETTPTNTIDYNQAEPTKNVQIGSKKSGIKLRLNPPKPPTLKPKILLRVKQLEQVSSQKRHGLVEKNDRRVRTPTSKTKKPRQKHCTQN